MSTAILQSLGFGLSSGTAAALGIYSACKGVPSFSRGIKSMVEGPNDRFTLSLLSTIRALGQVFAALGLLVSAGVLLWAVDYPLPAESLASGLGVAGVGFAMWIIPTIGMWITGTGNPAAQNAAQNDAGAAAQPPQA
jgi:hypothetical protein